MRGLEGRYAIVTGAGGGIGSATAHRFADEGAAVAVLDRAAFERPVPLGRIGRPDDLPGAICILAGEDAAFITGQTIGVSGDLTMSG